MTARTLDRPDATVSYWVEGPPHAATVLLLHGAALDHHAWRPQVRVLRDRYRVVTVDLRHHGASTASGAFRFHDAVDDVLALLDALARGAAGAGRAEPGRQHRAGGRAPRPRAGRRPGGGRRDVQQPRSVSPPRRSAARRRPALARLATRAGSSCTPPAAPPPEDRDARRPTSGRPRRRCPSPRPSAVLSSLVSRRPARRAGLPAAGADAARPRRRRPRRRHRRGQRGAGPVATPAPSIVVIPSASHLSNLDAPEAFTGALVGLPRPGRPRPDPERAGRAARRPAPAPARGRPRVVDAPAARPGPRQDPDVASCSSSQSNIR